MYKKINKMREGINQDIQSLPYWKNQEPPKYGQDYTDPLFPPNKNSLLGLDSSGNPIDPKTYEAKSKSIDTDKIGFFRPKEIFGDDSNTETKTAPVNVLNKIGFSVKGGTITDESSYNKGMKEKENDIVSDVCKKTMLYFPYLRKVMR